MGINYLYVAMPAYGFIMGGGALVNFGFCLYHIITKKEISVKSDLSIAKGLMIRNLIFTAMGGDHVVICSSSSMAGVKHQFLSTWVISTGCCICRDTCYLAA